MSTPAEDRAGLAPVPPTSAGDPNGAPERDPADNWGLGYSEPLPSVEDSPHWNEIQT